MPYYPKKGFTLVELLIVIAILAILVSVVVIVINPVEFTAQGRDAKKINDVRSLFSAINLFIGDRANNSLGEGQTVYVSLPDDASSSCASYTLPSLPSGWEYRCASSANIRKTNGLGWMPLNFDQIFGGSPLPYLPVQDGSDAGNYYLYVPDGWALAAPLGSVRYLRDIAPKDGGFDPFKFEAGKDLRVIAVINQLIGIWDFNDNGGVLVREIGITGNDGTVFGNPVWVPGIVGSGMSFDGNGDYVRVENQAGDSFSLSFWIKTSSPSLSGASCPDGNAVIASDIVGVGNDFSVTVLNDHVCFFTGNPDESVEGNVAVTNGNWHNIVVSRERGSLKKVYVDGILDGTGEAGNNVLNNNMNIEFGGSTVTGRYFSGIIDNVFIYNRILLDSEVMALSRSGI